MSVAIAIGTFDGVHLGHRHLFARLGATATALGARTALITFEPFPRAVLAPAFAPRLLLNAERRIELLSALASVVDVYPFTAETAALSAEQFLGDIARRLDDRIVAIVGGPDIALGHKRHGNAQYLRTLGARMDFRLDIVPELRLDGTAVRSGVIRDLIAQGDVVEARRFLGRWPTIDGTVVHGDGRGRTIGVPTANIAIDGRRLLPARGVYAVRARADGIAADAVSNIGTRPTVDGTVESIEVHILDFDGDLYDQKLEITLVSRLRDEIRFPSLQALAGQIERDIVVARQRLAAAPK